MPKTDQRFCSMSDNGFRTYGRMPRSIRIGERYYDELEMICLFSPDA